MNRIVPGIDQSLRWPPGFDYGARNLATIDRASS